MSAHPLSTSNEHLASTSRRAKIVCTLGPSSNSETAIRDLVRNGMDVARLNFSHGTHEEHARTIERVRRVARKEGRTIAVLQDLQGPKIRTGRLKDRTPVSLRKGSRVTITTRDVPGTSSTISTNFRNLVKDVRPGDRILLSDGLIELRVRGTKGEDVECEVINGGMLGEHQGINLPGTALSVPSMTQKDQKDLEFGLKHGVDLVALSFVRSKDDVRHIKRLIGTRGGSPPVIAKLEKPQAIEHLHEILEIADAVMVARGDLGVEMPPEVVPVIQKEIIRRAAAWGKPVITATQMLESMVENPRPTRAEASDVANAVFDGSDAVMLSAETAVGKYPREAVAFMSRIILEAEAHMGPHPLGHREHHELSITETICQSVAHAAHDLDMRAIAVFTETGTTARLISKYRPPAPIYAFSRDTCVSAWLNVCWGIHPVHSERAGSAEDMLATAERELRRLEMVAPGDVIGIVAGTKMASGSTNFMRLHVVGSAEEHAGRKKRRQQPRFKPLRRHGNR
jgi:pyruvate kinase